MHKEINNKVKGGMIEILAMVTPCLLTVLENSYEKLFLKIVFENYSLIFYRTNICLGT